MKLIDLSYEFYDGMYRHPRFPEMGVELKTFQAVERDGINVLQISFGNHIATHIDAPRHIIQDAETIDQLPLDSFYGTAVVLGVPKGPNGAVTSDDLKSAQLSIEGGDIVLLHTGWRAEFNSVDYGQRHPYLSEEGATFLAEKGVRMVGIDTRSVDLPDSLRGKGFHHTSLRVLLRKRIPVIHNLTNTELVCGKRVTLMAFPINFRGSDASPARVIALVD